MMYLQHFEGYDPEGFSMWFCEYKYPEENTINFIVMNKVLRLQLLPFDAACHVARALFFPVLCARKQLARPACCPAAAFLLPDTLPAAPAIRYHTPIGVPG